MGTLVWTDEKIPGATRLTIAAISVSGTDAKVLAMLNTPSASLPIMRPMSVASSDVYAYQATRATVTRQPAANAGNTVSTRVGRPSRNGRRANRTALAVTLLASAVITSAQYPKDSVAQIAWTAAPTTNWTVWTQASVRNARSR